MPTRAQVLGKESRWLLELDIGKEILRFSTEAIDVTDSSGRAFTYSVGLEDFALSLRDEGAGISVGLMIRAPVDWAGMVAAGGRLEQRPATLRRHYDGMVLESARVIIEGVTEKAKYGDPDDLDALAITVHELAEDAEYPIPQANWKVTADTWAVRAGWNLPENIIGTTYPMVIGYPGDSEAVARSVVAAYPGLFVEYKPDTVTGDDRLMVAGHRVHATTVEVWDLGSTGPRSEQRTVKTMQDNLGRTISYVDFNASVAFPPATAGYAENTEFYIGMSAISAGYGGGLEFGGAPLRGAGDIILYLLQTYTNIRIDVARMKNQFSILNNFKLDFCINAPTDVESFLKSAILPLLPVTERRSNAGLYYQVWHWDATEERSVGHIDADTQMASRNSALERYSSDIFNEFTINYQPSQLATGKFRKRQTLTGAAGVLPTEVELQDSIAADTQILGDYRCAISQQPGMFSRRPMSELSTSVIWESATAGLILQHLAAQHATPKRTVSYDLHPSFGWLAPGSVVTLNDSEISLSSVVALVDDIITGPAGIEASFILLDHPVQSSLTL